MISYAHRRTDAHKPVQKERVAKAYLDPSQSLQGPRRVFLWEGRTRFQDVCLPSSRGEGGRRERCVSWHGREKSDDANQTKWANQFLTLGGLLSLAKTPEGVNLSAVTVSCCFHVDAHTHGLFLSERLRYNRRDYGGCPRAPQILRKKRKPARQRQRRRTSRTMVLLCKTTLRAWARARGYPSV